jgi:hypothetical protein
MKSRPTHPPLRAVALAALLLCAAMTATAEPDVSAAKPARNSTEITLDIDVRSTVDRPYQGLRKAPREEHGKLYAIVSLTDASGADPLIRPVKQNEMLKQLRQELARRGFREITPAEKPEIVLTVFYGRGYLRNPYLNDVVMNETSDPPTATILGAMPTQLMRQKEYGFEERLQKANFEKLFIRVTAWVYIEPGTKTPKGKKPKPRELWKTDMIVDDPAHRDLNLFIQEMFAAGSRYFDQEIEKEEVTVSTDLPEGRVTLGPLEFPEDDAAKAKAVTK